MENKIQTSISLKYIDTALYERLEKIAVSKNCAGRSKKDMITYILEDYVNMHDLDKYNNPYLINYIRNIIDAACATTERNLGNRLMKLTSENTIQIGIMNRIILEYLGDMDNAIARDKLERFRVEAVEDLRSGKRPLSYAELISIRGQEQ